MLCRYYASSYYLTLYDASFAYSIEEALEHAKKDSFDMNKLYLGNFIIEKMAKSLKV